MADFDAAILRTMQNEGGYVNDPADPGGETKYGISKRAYPDIDIANLEFDQAKEIYRRDYWERLLLDKIDSQDLAEQLFDYAVNAGTVRAARELQAAFNLVSHIKGIRQDGIIGNETLQAVNRYKHQEDLLACFKLLRGIHYHRLAMVDIRNQKFFRGWLRRIGL